MRDFCACGTLKQSTARRCAGCYTSSGDRANASVIHGATRRRDQTPEYCSWLGAKQRCDNPKNRMFKWYGAKGIRFCERWRCFEVFLADMGPKPEPKDLYSIERNDVLGDYRPENCRWATEKEQARNKTSSKFVTWNGSSKTVAGWAEERGINKYTMYQRVERFEDGKISLNDVFRPVKGKKS